MPLHGFTAVDLGYQQGNAISNLVNRFEEPAFTATYLQLFEQIWNDPERLEDVTAVICDHIASVYQENSPERIYFLMLYNIFSEFLEDIDEDVLPNDLTGYQINRKVEINAELRILKQELATLTRQEALAIP